MFLNICSNVIDKAVETDPGICWLVVTPKFFFLNHWIILVQDSFCKYSHWLFSFFTFNSAKMERVNLPCEPKVTLGKTSWTSFPPASHIARHKISSLLAKMPRWVGIHGAKDDASRTRPFHCDCGQGLKPRFLLDVNFLFGFMERSSFHIISGP